MNEHLIPAFQKHWNDSGFGAPTAIQTEVYDLLKEKKDVVGISPTGSGKTLAYSIPLLEQIVPTDGIQLLILEPSQELAVQVGQVVNEWAKALQLNALTLIGGANIQRQIDKLKSKPEIIVGTPGRILELADKRKLKLHQVQTVVLDEADQLLGQDQLNTVREVVKKMPSDRQMGFFSATSNSLMQDLSKWFNVEPIWIDVTAVDDSKGEIAHAYIETPIRKRDTTLKQLSHLPDFRALVFFNDVASLTAALDRLRFEGVSAGVLHSERNKTERRQVLQDFRNGKIQYLLTTDLASRGLDIEGLDYVIQYDIAISKESYVHRSGRTGRMRRKGTVLTLVNERELRNFKQLIAPLELPLIQMYLYGGELVTEKVAQEETPQPEKESIKKVVPKKNKPAAPAPVQAVEAPVKKKKKNRTKKTKNKGARRKKSE
ncbi:DEAD/DEAH box helicase [Desemzia sp. RIT804]|uniref:DEAD/DEAH box helicase n=1 Tax=Desemzia sp. RIT 804 TaxID=2810209 RepID=UPI00194FF9B2|nr:DEAD/DEAH box helicase [Desemzia sp. RIT 804]MBM6614316.1 DEAD/DEAH box helicase [Desemzia sp. RIT 804]